MEITKHKNDSVILNQLIIKPLTKKNWNKFVKLFGAKGACGNCWCMYYRLGKTAFQKGKTDEVNKKAMKEIVWEGRPAGLLGFLKEQAIAWCAFAPREDFIKLENSRVHKRIDDKAVWSIPCFFIDKNYRRQGFSVELLRGAIRYAEENGIKTIEAYPAIPTQNKIPETFAWIGLLKSFERAGFEIVNRRSKYRPMVRYYIEKSGK